MLLDELLYSIRFDRELKNSLLFRKKKRKTKESRSKLTKRERDVDLARNAAQSVRLSRERTLVTHAHDDSVYRTYRPP